MAKRIWRDAPTNDRCVAVIRLKDKSWAMCGRRYSSDVLEATGKYLCKQHGRISERDDDARSR